MQALTPPILIGYADHWGEVVEGAGSEHRPSTLLGMGRGEGIVTSPVTSPLNVGYASATAETGHGKGCAGG